MRYELYLSFFMKERCIKARGVPVVLELLSLSTASPTNLVSQTVAGEKAEPLLSASPDRHSAAGACLSPGGIGGGSSCDGTGPEISPKASPDLHHLALTCLLHLAGHATARDAIR